MRFAAPLGLLLALARGQDYTHHGDDWDGLCKTGKQQSPVDLISFSPSGGDSLCERSVELLVPKGAENAYLNYGATAISAAPANPTFAPRLEVKAQSCAAELFALPQGASYQLIDFHFHAPAEHRYPNGSTLTRGPAELHFVFADEKREPKAVLGFVFTEDDPAASSKLLTQLTNFTASENAVSVVFRETELASANYTLGYPGSLTTPACGEGLLWLVGQAPVSKTQLEWLKPLTTVAGGGNYRSPQPLHDRKISRISLAQVSGARRRFF